MEVKINQFHDCNLTFQMDKTRIYSWILINMSTFFCPFFELNSLLVLYSEIIMILKILLVLKTTELKRAFLDGCLKSPRLDLPLSWQVQIDGCFKIL